MGRKWDGKTIKKSWMTMIRKRSVNYTSAFVNGRYNADFYKREILSDHDVCLNCKRFFWQHAQALEFSFDASTGFIEYECLVHELKRIVRESGFDKPSERTYVKVCPEYHMQSTNRTFRWTWKRDERLSNAIRGYINMTYRVAPPTAAEEAAATDDEDWERILEFEQEED